MPKSVILENTKFVTANYCKTNMLVQFILFANFIQAINFSKPVKFKIVELRVFIILWLPFLKIYLRKYWVYVQWHTVWKWKRRWPVIRSCSINSCKYSVLLCLQSWFYCLLAVTLLLLPLSTDTCHHGILAVQSQNCQCSSGEQTLCKCTDCRGPHGPSYHMRLSWLRSVCFPVAV